MSEELVLDFVGYAQCKQFHPVEILQVLVIVVVGAIDEVARDVLQDQLDQMEELLVEDLTINHKLGVVVAHDLSDPFGDERWDLFPLKQGLYFFLARLVAGSDNWGCLWHRIALLLCLLLPFVLHFRISVVLSLYDPFYFSQRFSNFITLILFDPAVGFCFLAFDFDFPYRTLTFALIYEHVSTFTIGAATIDEGL